ncbi:hypothetical protein LI180_11920, partial [Megasphaera massiliensis]|nr:hypothetical protein [Megasphaera massiliensis]
LGGSAVEMIVGTQATAFRESVIVMGQVIVGAMAAKPKLLFLDEPAAGMNPQETAELTELIRFIRDEFHI